MESIYCSQKQKIQLGYLLTESKLDINNLLTKHLPINVFLIDVNGYIAWGNERMLTTLGLSLDEFVGRHLTSWDEERWALCQKVIKDKQEYIEEEFYHNYYYLTSRKPLFDIEGNVIGIIGVSLDITQQKQAEIVKQEFIQNIGSTR